jgi:CheY-like chemotaxis protein
VSLTTPPAPIPEPDRGPVGILVVDDEEPIRRFLDAALSRLGHRVRLAPAAGEALLVLARERFDVVLTDLGLPDASGVEVARGAARCCPGTPVIMLTGWAEQIRDDPPEGVAQVLGKPVTLDALARALAAVVQSDRPMGFDNPNR